MQYLMQCGAEVALALSGGIRTFVLRRVRRR